MNLGCWVHVCDRRITVYCLANSRFHCKISNALRVRGLLNRICEKPMTVTPLIVFQSANLRGRRDMNKKLQDLQDIKNQRRSIIEAKTEDHTRFLIQEYLFNRTNMMDT